MKNIVLIADVAVASEKFCVGFLTDSSCEAFPDVCRDKRDFVLAAFSLRERSMFVKEVVTAALVKNSRRYFAHKSTAVKTGLRQGSDETFKAGSTGRWAVL